MWPQWMVDSWGYGGYGPFHMIIWIILVIAFVTGVVWRVVRRNRKKVILNSFCSGTFAQHNSKDVCHECPLCPRKRTSPRHHEVSANDPKWTYPLLVSSDAANGTAGSALGLFR